MERYLGLAPCPLCIIDRMIVGAIGAMLLLALIHNPARVGQRIYAIFGFLLSGIGLAVCARHIWLQNLPPQEVPDCTPDLAYLTAHFPIMKVLTTIFNSAGECAEIAWTFLSLSIPQQTALLFVAFTVLFLWIAIKSYLKPLN